MNTELDPYIERYTTPESALLKKINRETNAEVLNARMLSGPVQGRFFSLLSCWLKPARILEIGTYTGYSALCFAEGLPAHGKLITIDINAELEERVRGYFSQSPKGNQIEYIIGDATKVIPGLNETFDLVFIDADKGTYSDFFDLVIDKVPVGGCLIADNVLWSGKVLDKNPDKETRALMDFSKKAAADDRVENVIVPLRDGLMMMRKCKE